MSDQNPEVKFGGNTSGLNAAIDGAKQKLGEFGESVNGLKETLGVLGEAFLAAFAVEKLADFAKEMSGIGQQLERMSAMTGLPVGQVEDFQNAIKVLGGDSESAGMSLMRLERNIADAANNAQGPAANAFQRLGVSQKALAEGNVSQILEEMSVKMHDSADGANKLAAMMEVAGRGGMQLIVMLDQGKGGLEQMQQAIKATGPGLDKFAAQFDQSAQGIQLLNMAHEKMSAQIYAALEPSLDAATTGLTKFYASIAEAIDKGGALKEVIQFLGNVISGVTAAVLGLATVLESLMDIGVGAFNSLVDHAIGFGKAIDDIVHGHLKQAMKDWDDYNQKAIDDVKKGWAEAGQAMEKYGETLHKMMDVQTGNAPAGTGVGGGSKGAGHIAAPPEKGNGKDDAANDESAKRSIYSEDYAVKKEMDDLKVQSGQMTRNQELQDLQAELDKQHQLIDASFERQKALYDQDSVQYKRLVDEKYIADQKYAIEKMKLDQEAAKENAKVWTDAFNTIDRASTQMLNGILQGTQTWQQAMTKFADNLALAFIDSAAKEGLNWVKTELIKTQATMAGNEAREASTLSASAAGQGQIGANAKETVTSQAASAASSVYADVAAIPYVGWILAPPAAAAAFVAVEAFGNLIPLETGSMRVKEGAYHLHDDEAVLPKGEAEVFRKNAAQAALGRGGASGGDTHVHLNVSAMDSKDVSRFLEQHGSKIADTISRQFRNGRRPSWA